MKHRPFTLDDLLNIRRPTVRVPLHLSPAGRLLALSVQDSHREGTTAERYFRNDGVPVEMIGSRVLVADTTTGETLEPFPDGATSWGARWSPDGSRLAAYVAHEGPPCLWIWERMTNTLRPLPDARVRPFFGFEIPRWTPDGSALIAKLCPHDSPDGRLSEAEGTQPDRPTVTVFSFDPAHEGEEPGTSALPNWFDQARGDLGWVDVGTGDVRRLAANWMFRGWCVVADGHAVAVLRMTDCDETRQQLYYDLMVVPLDEASPRTIAKRVPQNYGICFSGAPDGRYLAYTTSERGERGRLFVVPVDGSEEPRELAADTEPDLSQSYEVPRWSADGRTIYCLTSGGVWAISMEDSGAKNITVDLDRKVCSWVQRPDEGTLWPSDEMSLLVSVRDPSTKREGLVRVDREESRSETVVEFEKTIGSTFSVEGAPDGSACYLVTEAAHHPPEIWCVADNFHTPRRLLSLNPDLEKVEMGTARVIEWRAPDGKTQHAALLLPPAYEEGERVPLIVEIYGGSLASNQVHRFGFGGHHADNAQLLAASGYAVLYPDLPMEKQDPLRQIPAHVLPAVNRAIDLGIADPDRLGLMGHSYGGYCTLALLTQTTRFRAAVCSAGMVNLTSFYGTLTEDGDSQWLGWSESGQARLGGSPWERREAYIENSPLFYLDRAETPLLLVHGCRDLGAHAQAGEAFSAARRLGQRVELRRYHEEGHWPGTWSETNLQDLCERVLAWFDEHLSGTQAD